MKLLDLMIATGGFYDFVCEIIRMSNDEQQENAIWEMWLHKCMDDNYPDFRRKVLGAPAAHQMTEADMKDTIHDSLAVLSSFVPDGMADGSQKDATPQRKEGENT